MTALAATDTGIPSSDPTASPTAAAGFAAAPARPGVTVWLSGLPSAGKTTLALALARELDRAGRDTQVLDGDEMRTHLTAGLGFSADDRHIQGTRIGFVAELLARHGVVTVVPVIAPYERTRREIAARHAEQGTPYLLVHVATGIDVCAERDVKGLYARAFRGEITSMTGVDDPYEVPAHPDLRLDTAGRSVAESVAVLLQLLAERGMA